MSQSSCIIHDTEDFHAYAMHDVCPRHLTREILRKTFHVRKRRIHLQRGQKESLAIGLQHGAAYFPMMERIFRAYHLPPELSRIPLIESGFRQYARSKVGASGLWQLMPATAAQYLTLSDSIDERMDPELATEAAAQIIARNLSYLGSLPLAVTAYNHGRKSLMRASLMLDTFDLSVIHELYQARSFGFASSSYYAELVAVLQLAPFVPAPPDHPRVRIRGERPMTLQQFAQCLHVTPRALMEANPAFLESMQTIEPTQRLFLPPGAKLGSCGRRIL